MHIILGILGAIVTILILLNRLEQAGIDVGWLNPFTWHRRRTYRLNHDLNPVFKLESPLDTAAVLIVGVAKIDGDLTQTQKLEILNIFENTFKQSASTAKELLASSVHLIGNGQEFFSSPERAVERSYDKFTPEQVDSVKTLLTQIATVEGEPSQEQNNYINRVLQALPTQQSSKW